MSFLNCYLKYIGSYIDQLMLLNYTRLKGEFTTILKRFHNVGHDNLSKSNIEVLKNHQGSKSGVTD